MKNKHLVAIGLGLALSLSAVGQSDVQKLVDATKQAETPAPAPVVAQSAAQNAFDKLKTLAGSWEGTFDGGPVHVSMRVTSRGNTLMHEMRGDGPDDPITMITVDGDRLLLTHYCDAGNQPRMLGTVSPDGKTITFNFLDATNLLPSQGGHMQHAVFTFIDPGHHTELWEFAMANGKPMGATLDLKRSK